MKRPRARFAPRRGTPRLLAALVALVLSLLGWWTSQSRHAPPPAPEPGGDLAAGVHRVQRVVDGDTLLLEPHVRVRLIGVDTPETVKPNTPVQPFGPEASQFTKDFVSGGEVRLEFDGPRHDKYGRYLALVWVGDRMLNEELLRAGLAVAEPQYHFSQALKDRFLRVQAEAQAARRGMWAR